MDEVGKVDEVDEVDKVDVVSSDSVFGSEVSI